MMGGMPGVVATRTDWVRQAVQPKAAVYTDALPPYNELDIVYAHKVIDHAEKHVEAEVHTNGLENFWSLLKRTIHGTYISIEPFHLFRCLDEQAFRFNNREMNDPREVRPGRRLGVREAPDPLGTNRKGAIV